VFAELYQCHVTAVYRYCYARSGGHDEAEELTAQVFLAAWEAWSRYRQSDRALPWLFAIARHKCADFHRGRYAHPTIPLDSLPSVAAVIVDPERQALHQSILDCIQHAFAWLAEDRAEALRLRFWGGLSVRETAAVMDRSESAVKMLVSRAILDLKRRCLDHE
jgi:RNA polymerase sigma-70 factor, ECF subfamily